MNKLKEFWYRIMANQLRRPSGLLAKLTGDKMSIANTDVYKLTLGSLPISEGNSILEIGFGNGKHFADLVGRAPGIQLSGIEHSPQMLAEATKNNATLISNKRLNLQTGSSDKLPYPDDSFDLVFCINVIYFWEDPSAHLEEIQRVLKPGGLFSVGFRPKDHLIEFPFSKYGFTLYSAREWQDLILKFGFQVVEVTTGEKPEQSLASKKVPSESMCILSKKMGDLA